MNNNCTPHRSAKQWQSLVDQWQKSGQSAKQNSEGVGSLPLARRARGIGSSLAKWFLEESGAGKRALRTIEMVVGNEFNRLRRSDPGEQ
jgi:hypothetical protein